MSENQSSTQTLPHVDGATLVAVAEGDPEKQPSEDVLSHLFTCDECSQNLREVRTGLTGLGGMEPVPDLEADPMLLEWSLASGDEPDPSDRARKFMLWMLIAGVILVGAMMALPRIMASFAGPETTGESPVSP